MGHIRHYIGGDDLWDITVTVITIMKDMITTMGITIIFGDILAVDGVFVNLMER